jgi:hypothetical protein
MLLPTLLDPMAGPCRGWDHGCARRATLDLAQMATGEMTADIRTFRSPGDRTGAAASGLPDATAGARPVVLSRIALPAHGTTQYPRGRLTVVTEKTHPEAFGHDGSSDEGLPEDEAVEFHDIGNTAQIMRRRGPLVTRWIGFSAQRRRAQERSNRLRDRHHGGSEARSNS